MSHSDPISAPSSTGHAVRRFSGASTVLAPGSFDEFYQTEYQMVLRVAVALTGDRQTAEDIASEVFLDAYRRWSKISRYDRPSSWARRAAANQASTFRRNRLNVSRLLSRIGPREPQELPPLPDAKLWSEVRRLPRRQAQAIVLHYLEQLSTQEISEVLNISQASAKTHLQRARATLAERLGEEYPHE